MRHPHNSHNPVCPELVIKRARFVAEKFTYDVVNYGQQAQHPLISLTRFKPKRPVLYLSAGIHGDEPAGVEAVLQIMERFDEKLSYFSIIVCPLLNPAGLEAGSREDHTGKDLNRDYKTSLSSSTRAHKDFLLSLPAPDFALSFHEDWEAGGFYLYEINTGSRDTLGPRIIQKIQVRFDVENAALIDGHVPTQPGYIYHPPKADLPEEWPEAIWLVNRAPCLSLTFETPSSREFNERVEMHLLAFWAFVEELSRVSA